MVRHLIKGERWNIKPYFAVIAPLQNTKPFKLRDKLIQKLVIGFNSAWQKRSIKPCNTLQRAFIFKALIRPVCITEKRLTVKHLTVKPAVIILTVANINRSRGAVFDISFLTAVRHRQCGKPPACIGTLGRFFRHISKHHRRSCISKYCVRRR